MSEETSSIEQVVNEVVNEAMDESGSFQDAQDVNSGTWAEQVESAPKVARPDSDDYEEIELPEVLHQLISISGVCLVVVPDNTWKINGYAAKLRRNLSVTFSVDVEITGLDILEGFIKVQINPDNIASIQYRSSNRSWVVSFTDQATKEAVLELGRIMIKEFLVFLGDADLRTVIVKIYEAPPEMPDTVIIGRLSHYGRFVLLKESWYCHWYSERRMNCAYARSETHTFIDSNCWGSRLDFLFWAT